MTQQLLLLLLKKRRLAARQKQGPTAQKKVARARSAVAKTSSRGKRNVLRRPKKPRHRRQSGLS